MKTKRIIYLSVIWLAVACVQKPTMQRSVIKGELPEFASDELQFEINDTMYSTNVDTRGNFRKQIPLSQPGFARIKGLNQTLFLIPNDSIFIEKQNENYLLKGAQSALISNYYMNWKRYSESISDTADFQSYYNQPPEEFVKQVNEWIKVYMQPLNALQKKESKLNSDFVYLERQRIKYMLYADLNDYKNQEITIPDTFYDYLRNVNFNDNRLIYLDEYRYFLTSYVLMNVRNKMASDKIQVTSDMLDIIDELFKIEKIRNVVSKEIMRQQTSKLAINALVLQKFRTICTNRHYIMEIEQEYEQLKPLMKGNKAPDFELLGTDNKKVSLNNFKGKYLLIDVWSTTCSPCFREFPLLDDIRKELKGRNIEIIAACLSDESDWRIAIEKHKLEGSQYRVGKGWNSDFRRDYLKSSGVPVYILISPSGHIVDARAPKPSENLMEVLSKLDI